MARDAQERATAYSGSPEDEEDFQGFVEPGPANAQEQTNRRETLLEQTTPTLRIWELNDLTKIENWTEPQKKAALEIQKQVMEDYTQLASTYNSLLAKSKEMDAQIQTQDAQILELQDRIEQLQEVI